MNRRLEKLILKIYILLPAPLKQSQKITGIVSPIAERQLSAVRQEVTRANWQRCQLEGELSRLKDATEKPYKSV